MLETIETEAIKHSEDRVMKRIKLGQEGWLEEGMLKGRQEGRQEGIQEGRQEGIQEGRQEGIQEGRQEGVEEVALRMLEDGMDIEAVCRITKLNRSSINKLGVRKKKKA